MHFFPDEKVDSEEVKALDIDIKMTEPPKSPEMHEEQNESEVILNSELNMNEDLSHTKDVGLEEDGGHFNRNKDAQIGFEDPEEIQKGPHAILENPVDMGFHFEVDPSSGVSEFSFSFNNCCCIYLAKTVVFYHQVHWSLGVSLISMTLKQAVIPPARQLQMSFGVLCFSSKNILECTEKL